MQFLNKFCFAILFCLFTFGLCLEIHPPYASLLISDPEVKIHGIGNVDYKIRYHPADFGPFFVNHTGNTFKRRVQVVSNQCSPYNTAYDGTSYVGTFILYDYASPCSFADGIATAQQSNAAGLIVYGCDPSNVDECGIPGRLPLWLYNTNMSVTIPIVMISHEDVVPINKTIHQNNASVITMEFPATTYLDPSDKNFLKDFKQQLWYDTNDQVMSGTISINDWNGQDDPCVGNHRLTFVWCEAGRIVGLNFPGIVYYGILPPSISQLTELKYVNIIQTCISASGIPYLLNNTKLVTFVFAATIAYWEKKCGPVFYQKSWPNYVPVGDQILPANFSIFPDLEVIDLQYSLVTKVPVGLNNLSKLKLFYLHHQYAGPVNFNTALTSSNLQIFDISFCGINQPLNLNFPILNLSLKDKLFLFNIGNNQFYSDVSLVFDNLDSLTYVDLSHNAFTGQVPQFKDSPLVTVINLQNNNFNGSIPSFWNKKSLTKIDISNNQIVGPWNLVDTNLQEFQASHNLIDPNLWNAISPNWAEVLFFSLPPKFIRMIDFSSNKIQGPWDNAYFSGKSFGRIYFSNNKITTLPKDLSNSNFRTLDVSSNDINFDLKDFAGDLPATIEKLNFQGNPKMRGRLQDLKWIRQDPTLLTKLGTDTFVCPSLVGKDNYIMELSIDASYYNYEGCKCDRGFYQNPPNCQNIDTSVTINSTSGAFTDKIYDDQRLMKGINTNWVMKAQDAKVYSIQLQIFPQLFNEEEDYIEIYEGGASLSGKRVFAVRGTDIKTILYTQDVLDSTATLVFKSRKTGGQHFNASFSIKLNCPSDYKFDPFTNKCQYLFEHSVGLQGAVWAVSSVYTLVLIIVTAVVVNKRNSLIIRSASFPFCFVMLICMIIQCAGSIFYAMSPKLGEFVCHCRPWFTALPLVGTLSALLVKADRIRKIFGSKELVVQAITNVQLAKAMGIMLAGELILLLAFSGGNLTESQLKLGTGTVAGKLVYSCNTDADNYNVWIAIQFAYIALFLFAGVVEAWGVRNVPSAFNEGPHIASCLMSLVVLLVILIPVNYLVDDNPNALIMIRGLGQVLVTAVMSFFLFGPKLYYIIEGKENDKTLSSIGSSKSSSSSSSSSHSEA